MHEEKKKKEPLDPKQLETLFRKAARRLSARDRSGIPYMDSDDPYRDYIPPPPDRFKKS